jgi:nucleotide-binding universal stress UspA family protein
MAEGKERQGSGSALIRRIVACLDGSALAERALPHALAAATALGAPLTLLRVLEHPGAEGAPADPMEWEIQRREARSYLDRLAAAGPARDASVEAEVIEGKAAEEICRWCRHRGIDLTVVCTHGMGGHSPWALASTARKLLDRAPGSLLLVPIAGDAPPAPARYRRVLVPIDGSPRAESVLPIAARIASAHGAELLVAHVVPWPELIEFGPLDAEDLELRDRLVRRNERVARSYLDRLRARLSESHVVPRMLLFQGGDVASRLARLAADEHVDLLVLSAHGRTAHAGVPCGGVTAELISRSTVPLLIVRSGANRAMQRVGAPEPAAARLPQLATT